VLIVIFWLALIAAVVYLSKHLDRPVQLCLFRRLTGYDCPTCGSTRGILSLLHGHIIEAWLYNPLLLSLLIIFCIVTAIRVFFARGIQINLTRIERLFAWILAVILFAGNWMYIIFYVD
jgi:hypothetical protein